MQSSLTSVANQEARPWLFFRENPERRVGMFAKSRESFLDGGVVRSGKFFSHELMAEFFERGVSSSETGNSHLQSTEG